MNENIPHTPTDAVQLFIIVRNRNQEISKSDIYDSNIRLCLKILKMGSITFFGEFHIGTGTEAIFFSDHTDFFLPLAIGHLS